MEKAWIIDLVISVESHPHSFSFRKVKSVCGQSSFRRDHIAGYLDVVYSPPACFFASSAARFLARYRSFALEISPSVFWLFDARSTS